MFDDIARRFSRRISNVDYWTLRLVDTHFESLSVRQNVTQPPRRERSTGAMLSVTIGEDSAYAASSDLSERGIQQTIDAAREWALACRSRNIMATPQPRLTDATGHYRSPVAQKWESWSLKQKLELLRHACRSLAIAPEIIDWEAGLARRQRSVLLLDSDNARIEQVFNWLYPGMRATANKGTRTQYRSHGSAELACQGGLEQLERVGYAAAAQRVSNEAMELLAAPKCPSARMDLLLMPTQMVLQLHETVGHPLELDRILGDERNYAGGSFVTPAMVGQYQYGSELMNVIFDPTESEELAAYGYDDEGQRGKPQPIISEGRLDRLLGSVSSQQRSNLPGVCNSLASDWNRPPIDRIGNLNLEAGDHSLEEMIEATEFGVLMDTNRSWSIDDQRNKFQFGCEYARMIRDGELAEVVRNPNYRGISATFWRSLAMVGDHQSYLVSGTPYCGKGEPNQMAQVGHASPACLFRNVEVFGGA